MATINLGNIKFNWKGTYNAGTTYAIDDVVAYNGSSYVCIQATTGNLPTVTAYWNVMSSAGTNGTNGTDVGTTITTQGDLLYRDASGLQRLGAGTSGMFLKTQGTGANPVWGDAGGGVVQFKTNHASSSVSQATTSSGSFQDVGLGMSVTITPTSTSNKILIFAQGATQAQSGRTRFTINKSGDSSGNGDLHAQLNASADSVANIETNSPDGNDFISMFFLDDNINSTNALTYKLRFSTDGGDTHFGVASSVPVMYAIELDSGVL